MCRPPAMSADRPAASDGGPVDSHTRHPVGNSVPPSRSQHVFRHVCHGAGDPAAAHRFTRQSRPRRRLIVQRRPTGGGGDSLARRSGGGPMAVALPRSRSPRTLPSAVLGATLPAMLIVRRRRWGPVIGRERRRVQPVIPPLRSRR